MSTIRIAMWSGPRNISTAMMYAFANRPDCVAWDEPFYAFYLDNAGIEHPMSGEIIAAGETCHAKVIARCLGEPGGGKTVFYQKHMTHHMLAGYSRDWIGSMANAFLIRSPEQVLASYVRKRATVELRDIGFVEQAEIFDQVAQRNGTSPPVADADDILANPRAVLSRLCTALGIAFSDHMLAWPVGPKPHDGVWARHWYGAVWRSEGFRKPHGSPAVLDRHHSAIADAARPYYEQLYRHRLIGTG